MSLSGKTFVIAGATGVVGSGAARLALDAGATVVAISRSAGKLDELRSALKVGAAAPFHAVVADFDSEASAAKAAADVSAALGGRPIDHVLSSVGFVTVAQAPTATSIDVARKAFDDGFFNSVLVAKAFLPGMKARAGSSFTMVSGGLAHGLSFPGAENLWLAATKNAAVNALNHGLFAETAKDAVRVNTACIHFGVAPIGGAKNQLGMDALTDTLGLAPAFLQLANGTSRGRVICLGNLQDVASVH